MGRGTGKKSLAPDLSLDAGAATGVNPLQFHVPYQRNPHFTGRSRLLDDLHRALMGEGLAVLNQIAAIAGLGGIGKTQTAVEYAYRSFFETQTYEWVFWVTADTELALVTGLADIGRSLHLRDGTLEELATQTKQWLMTHDRWLLIFDNADEPEVVKPWLPRNPNGRVLLTSRAQQFVRLGIKAPIMVPSLSLLDSIRFLFERTDRTVPVCEWATKTTDPEFTAAEALTHALDGLPLALEQAAAYIQQTNRAFVVYWQYYQQQQLTLLERGKPETGDYPKSVATTWLLNFQAVAERSPASVPLLQLSAVLAPDDIPEWFLLQGATALGLTDCTDELALGDQLAALAAFSLIQQEPGQDRYRMHRMVQAAVWHQLIPIDRQDWLHRVIAGLNAVFPDVTKFERWAACGQLVPHVQAIDAHQAVMLDTPDWALLLSRTGYCLKKQGRYAEAEPLLVGSLQIHRQQLGVDHPETATSLNNLASLYESQGRYDETEPLYLLSLQIFEKQAGSDHLNTAISLNNLAGLYRLQGRYAQAETTVRRSLQIREEHLGKDHTTTAESMNNLAALYWLQGRYTEAEPLFRCSLQIREKYLGADHPDTATSLNNLAELYRFQGRYTEAEALFVRSLQIDQQSYGEDHPDVATDLNNLALLYKSQERYAEAERLYRLSLQIRKQQLGTDHPDTAISLNNLAELYRSQGHYTEAEPLFQRALQVCEQQLGAGHRNTQQICTNLAILYDEMAAQFKMSGCYNKVVKYLEKAIALRQPTK